MAPKPPEAEGFGRLPLRTPERQINAAIVRGIL
jgi:hypothetical protein